MQTKVEFNAASAIREAVACDAGLCIEWTDGSERSRFPWSWLRDHGEDENSLDPQTQQRRVDTFAIPAGLLASVVRVHDDGRVEIRWQDAGAPTFVSAACLRAFSRPSPVSPPATPSIERLIARGVEPWHCPPTPDAVNGVSFDALTGDAADEALADWLGNLRRDGYCLVHDVPSTALATERLARCLAPPKPTIFGETWALSANVDDHEDTAYTTTYLAPHTDGTYYHDAPGLQLFNCLDFEGSGGESLLVDGAAVALELARQDREALALLAEVAVPGRYLEPGVHLEAERPVLRLDRVGELRQVSFNNFDRAPFRLPDADMARFYRAYAAFHALLSDESRWLEIPMRPGMALILDNWRVLHGRHAYRGRREFHGCYLDHADFESRLRVLDAAMQGTARA